MPSQSRICATSCGWMPATSNETIPARRSAGGPNTPDPVELAEPLHRVDDQLVLVLLDRVEPDLAEM